MRKSFCFVAAFLVLGIYGCENGTHDGAAKKQGAMDNEISLLEKRVTEKPDSTPLRMTLVDKLDSNGQYGKALAQMDSLIKADSLHYGLWFRKAQIYEHAKDTPQAISYYNIAARIYPSQQVLFALTNLYAETKDPMLFAVCDRIRDMRLGNESDSYVAFFTAVYYARKGEKDKAHQFLDLSIQKNYSFVQAFMEKGYLYYDNKQYDLAMKQFNTASRVNNIFPDAIYWIGKCQEATGQNDAAFQSYQKTLFLDKGFTEAQTALYRLASTKK